MTTKTNSELSAGRSPESVISTVEKALDKGTQHLMGAGGLDILVAINRDASLAEAAAVTSNHTGPLAGVPYIVKDNIVTLETPTTCGSKILAGYVSPFEASVITKLRNLGAVNVGKSNMDEFAMGSSTENSAYGPTKNPVDPSRVPGGSSGGSAAAVASGIVPLALGSETGGSVRQPAAFCGIVGVKPTYGRVSRYGLVAFSSSLDQIGVFANSVNLAAVGTFAISGLDQRDSTSVDIAVPSFGSDTFLQPRESEGLTADDRDLAGITVGIPQEYFPDRLDPDIRNTCDRAIAALKERGAAIREVSLPHTDLAVQVYYVLAPAEASSNLSRFDGVRYGVRIEGKGDVDALYEASRSSGFGDEVIRRIMLGTYFLSHGAFDAYYTKAKAVQALIRRDFSHIFDSGVNVLFTPTTPTVAFSIGEKKDLYETYLSDVFTATANLAGVPAMSLPIGRVQGLPVGGQLIANHFDELTMFRVAGALETALGEDAHR